MPVFKKRFFLLKSSFVRDQYSLIDLGNKTIKVEKVINIGLNKEILKEKEYFNENLGRKNNNLLGGEETNLCARINKKEQIIKYIGQSILYHNIEKNRLSMTWIIKKIYFSGYTRFFNKGKMKSLNSNKTYLDYLILPVYLIVYLLGFIAAHFKE